MRSRATGQRRAVSVRASAALAALLVLTPVLALASVAAVLLQRHDLTDSVFFVADEQAQTLAGSLGGEPATIAPMLGGEETLVQVVDRSGTVTRSSPALGGIAALTGVPPSGGPVHSTRTILEEEEKFAVVAVDVPGSDSYVVVARSLEAVDQATASTTRILLVGVPTVLALIAALSWQLTGRALRPVEELRARASEITAAGGDARLPDLPRSIEIGRLAMTLNEMLDRLDQNARAQRQFVADASHELRSPIAAIKTVMEVADPAGPTDWGEARSDVLAETARLERLVGQLLFLARQAVTAEPGAGHPSSDAAAETSLAALVRAEVDRPRRLPVRFRPGAEPLARVDQPVVAAVVGNLLDNAARHARSQVTVTLEQADGTATVVVEDDGAGIPAADAERVFDRFVRLDEARDRDAGGSGLGLSIARAAARSVGGDVTVGASATGGAAFRFTLPAVPSQHRRTRGHAAR